MCARALQSWVTEAGLGVLIVVTFILAIVETDAQGDLPTWLRVANYLLLSVYTLEVSVRLFVFRAGFFFSLFNVMDLVIVCIDMLSTLVELFLADSFPSLTVLRIFRMLRLARSYKIIVKFPQLALMVKGLANAFSAVMYGVGLLFVILAVWSICAVQLIHPVNKRVALQGLYAGCNRCETAFATVPDSMVTFTQQIIAGDSWGQVTIPIMEEAPLTGWFFFAVFISVNLTIVNVMLAVIVDTAMKTSEEDNDHIEANKKEQTAKVEMKFRRLCGELDTDASGDLTLQELFEGIQFNPEFYRELMAMDMNKDDMHLVFSILDTDGAGVVNYEDFVTELFKMKSHDSNTMLVFIRHYVTEIRRSLEEQLSVIRHAVVEKTADECKAVHYQPLPSKVAEAELDELALLPSILSLEPLVQLERPDEPEGKATAEGPADNFGEELRRLRRVISEDLVRSMRSVAERSEVHTRLLASIARDSLSLGGAATSLAAKGPSQDACWQGAAAPPECASMRLLLQSPAGRGALERRSAGLVGLDLPSHEPRPTSAWGLRRTAKECQASSLSVGEAASVACEPSAVSGSPFAPGSLACRG